MARQRLLKKEPRGHPERLSDGHGPEAVPTVRSPRESLRRPRPGSGGHTRHAASPRHRLNAATRHRNTGTKGLLGPNHLRNKPAHRTRGMTDVIRRQPLCVKHGQKHRGHRCGHHPRIWHDRMATHGHSHKTSMIGDFPPPSEHASECPGRCWPRSTGCEGRRGGCRLLGEGREGLGRGTAGRRHAELC